MFKIVALMSYSEWYEGQTLKIKGLISSRLERITDFGHFGEAKHLSPSLSELKWKNGLRIYFTLSKDSEGNLIILLTGGNKNSQKKDIRRSHKLLIEIQRNLSDEKI